MIQTVPQYVRTFVPLVAFWLIAGTAARAEMGTIVADPGPFESIEQAASAEARVDWRNADRVDDTVCTECFAATELRAFLPACTNLAGEDLRLAGPSLLPKDGHVIVLGSGKSNPLLTQLVKDRPRPDEMAAPESFRIVAERKGGRIVTVIEGADRVGTLYGTYAYLYRLGMRWHGLGELGTTGPEEPSALPAELDIVERPDYVTRGFWPWMVDADEDFFLWMARNRLNLWTPEEGQVPIMRKLGLQFIQGGHIVQYICLNPKAEYPYNHAKFDGDEAKPEDPYKPSPAFKGDANNDGTLTTFEAHPEWYGLVRGKRSSRIGTDGGDNYCTSNADATAELAKNVVRELADGRWRDVDILNFWMLDNGDYCQCDKCKQQGTPTDRMFAALYAINKEIRRAHRDGRLGRMVKLSSAAYHETLSPPTKPLPDDFDFTNCFIALYPIERTYTHAFADPKSTKVNRHLLERYRQWTAGDDRTYQGDMLIGEYYNVSSFASLPLVFAQIMAVDIPWYHAHGTRHFNYMHTPVRLWGTWALNQSLMAALLWDVDTDVDTFLEEYFQRRYPTTTEVARRFYDHIESASSNMKAFKHYTWEYSLRRALHAAIKKKDAELFPREDLRYFPHHPDKNDGLDVVEIVAEMRAARAAIDEALMRCQDDAERKRLLEDEQRFDYGEAMVDFIHRMVRTVMLHQKDRPAEAAREFTHLQRAAERLEAMTAVTHSAGEHANFANGLAATQLTRVYDFLKKRYGPKPTAAKTLEPVATLVKDSRRIEIPGKAFVGGGRKHRPDAVILGSKDTNWVYGQATDADTMTVAYALARNAGEATLLVDYATLAGKDGDAAVPIRIAINDHVIYAGMPEPAHEAFGQLRLSLPKALLGKGVYRLGVRNLDPGGGVNERPWFAVRRVAISAP